RLGLKRWSPRTIHARTRVDGTVDSGNVSARHSLMTRRWHVGHRKYVTDRFLFVLVMLAPRTSSHRRVAQFVLLSAPKRKAASMRSRAWFVVVMTGLAVACGSTVNVGRERTLLLEVDNQWSQSTNDVDKFLSYYATDAAVYPPGMPIAKGTAPIREAFIKMRSMPGFTLQWKPTGATVSGAGDLGYTTGTYRMTV